MTAALPVLAAALFTGAFAAATATIVGTIAPQWRRIASLVAGRPEVQA